MEGRFRWLLEQMCRRQGIDVQEIDSSLSFGEAKAEIEEKYRTRLVLNLDRLEEPPVFGDLDPRFTDEQGRDWMVMPDGTARRV